MVYTAISISLESPWVTLSTTTQARTTLHTTTSPKTSSSAAALQQLTGAYIASSSSSTPLNQITGAYTALTTGTAEVGVYTLVTYNGGLCRQSVTDSSSLITYASYVAATTLNKRDSASVLTITATPTTTGPGGLPVGTTAVPVTAVPYCEAVTATGSFQAPLVSSGETTEVSGADHTLNTGQKAGVAIGVVTAVVLVIVAIVWVMHKQGRWRQGTPASRNLWGAEDAVGSMSMTQGNTLVSGMGLRDVLYNGRHVSGRG